VPAELVKPPVPEGGLNIPSYWGVEGDLVTDRCGTARLGGHGCPRKAGLNVQRVSCDGGRLDPARDRDFSNSCI